MTARWACIDNPAHGSFLRAGIEAVQAICAWARRPMGRLVCPRCAAEDKPGFVKPATQEEN